MGIASISPQGVFSWLAGRLLRTRVVDDFDVVGSDASNRQLRSFLEYVRNGGVLDGQEFGMFRALGTAHRTMALMPA
jgi:hypothetical protein